MNCLPTHKIRTTPKAPAPTKPPVFVTKAAVATR